jgi:Membrane-associated sensor, integral membrane domain
MGHKRKWKSATNWVYASSNVISCASGLPWGLRVLAERRASDEFAFSVATAPTTARHRQLAFGVVIATLVAYVVIVVPNAAIPLPRTDSFVPAVFAVIFVADLVTAVLLYAQFSATGSRPLLVLASGYLFSSLIVVGHALTYPGAFAPTGLLGAGPQSAAWLNALWRFGLTTSMAGYAVLRSGRQTNNAVEYAPRSAISWSVAIVIVAVFTLTYAVTAGHEFVPPVVLDGKVLPLGRYANGGIVLTSLLALVLLLVLTRGRSILDLWLIVVAIALLAESLVITFFVPARFTFGFYAFRIISLPVLKVVLIVLLWETMRLYANLSISNRELQREPRTD